MELNARTTRRRHVLIVDDDIELSWSFKEILEQCGYDATIVPDGGLALKFVLSHELDAIVCDLQMARLDGDLLYATIERSKPALAGQFVFIAGGHDSAPVERFIDSTGMPVLRKPVAMAALLDEVMRVAERSVGRPA